MARNKIIKKYFHAFPANFNLPGNYFNKITGVFMIKSLIILAIMISLSSCTSSLLYNPAVNLPKEPLKKGEGQAMAGIGALGETRPHKADANIIAGQELLLRYGFSDHFTLQARYWGNFINWDWPEHSQRLRTGFAISSIILLNDPYDEWKFGLMPQLAFLFGGYDNDGRGGALSAAVWFPNTGIFYPYIASGPAFGYATNDYDGNEYGYGWITNLGTAIRLSKYFDVNVEFTGALQYNKYDDVTNFIPAPGVSITYNF